MLQVKFSPAALLEIRDSIQWLSEQSPAAAEGLASEIARLVDQLRHHPESGSPVRGRGIPRGLRRLALHRYRYLLVYRQDGNVVSVVALAHTSRKPGYWVDRA